MILGQVPSNENIIPYIVWALFGIVSGVLGWLMKSNTTKLEEILRELRENRETDIKERSSMAAAIALLTFKIKHPEVNVSDEANQIANRPDEKK